MDVHLDVPTAGYAGRLEILEGPTGRRVRSEADRARIAAESLMPGVQVAVVARKHGATRWQIYDWRRRLEEPSAPQRTMRPPKPAPAKVEIVIDDMVIRTAVDLEHLAQVIRAVRASR
ncbi:transposase [Mesorhizobium sp. LNHC221B00]|uniref:transposase n=1 Tax=Mesorhizobium sp. LNHC221B00 TaxID=1287233 RepID=UPI001FD88B68|nr:transposase [Mesorhizobium sp. LNHC221B00]